MPHEPISSDDVPWTESRDVPRFGLRWRHLTRAALGEDYHVGIAIEELAPGMQSAPAHWHVHEEEHVYILEGALTARIGDRRFPMRAGDYVCFPAGQQAGHCLINETDAPCRYVIVGERNPNEVVVYTDSNKMLVRALGRRAIYDLAARRGYWDGEDTGLAARFQPTCRGWRRPRPSSRRSRRSPRARWLGQTRVRAGARCSAAARSISPSRRSGATIMSA